MDRIPRITVVDNVFIGEYEPGNGTRYTAIAVPWTATPEQVMGRLGFVADGWLVVSGNSGRAHLFQRYGTLSDNYIAEKLGGYGGDFPYLCTLIRRLIGRPELDDMPEDKESYYNERAENRP